MNYPNGIKKGSISTNNNKEIDYKNRGMTLEGELNDSNLYYKETEKYFIYN